MDEIKEIAAALAKFQEKMPVLKKTGQNFAKGTAATIGDIITIAKQGAAFGLSFSQRIDYERHEESGVITAFVESTMLHGESGQSLTSGRYLVTPAKPNDPASFGSAVTYAKKNSLQALYGIADHNDDDVDWDLGPKGIIAEDSPPPAPPPPKQEPVAQASEMPLDAELAAASDHAARLAIARRVFKTDTPDQRQPTMDEAKLFINLTDKADLMELFNTMRPEGQPIIDMFSQRKKGVTV
jgi:hypothetical protein